MNYKEHYRVDALEFDYWGADQISPTEKRRNEVVFELAGLKPGDKVLDIGSGRGWFSIYAAGQKADVTAVDLSRENLQRVKEANSSVNTVYGDAIELPFTDEKFDLIVALELLEHLVEPKTAILNWSRFLKPAGRLLVTVPYNEIIRYTLCIHCNHKTPINAHLHSFDQDSLIKLLNHNGFWVKQTRLFSHKVLSHLRINNLTGWLPFRCWKAMDKCCSILGRKYSYLAVSAVRKD
jgi:ubiquinone/menaquinone biosynthesis C-methylase UbiE